MPQRLHPGEHKLHMVGDDARQARKAKQRVDTRMRMAKLRKVRQEQTHIESVVDEQKAIRQAIERYEFLTYIRSDESLLTNSLRKTGGDL